jgi:hypothetical protein
MEANSANRLKAFLNPPLSRQSEVQARRPSNYSVNELKIAVTLIDI